MRSVSLVLVINTRDIISSKFVLRFIYIERKRLFSLIFVAAQYEN